MTEHNKVHARKFIRHPTDIPIEVWNENAPIKCEQEPLSNVSLGGLAFKAKHFFPMGTTLRVRVPHVIPPFETVGRVVWCREQPKYYDVGVEFICQEDAFQTRMVEQVCQIERYRNMLEKQGRHLSTQDAAMEWIELYGSSFPLP
ncbi:PilZ domain-containing protein [Beggiatoa leptomitoformis]|nr:PilZ domain-containing protein [Beggiatoa leptomitoformis]